MRSPSRPAPEPEQVRLLMMRILLGHGVDNAAEAMTAALVIAAQAAAMTQTKSSE